MTTLPANPIYYGITWLAGSVIIVHSGNRRISVHTLRVQEKVRSGSVGASQVAHYEGRSRRWAILGVNGQRVDYLVIEVVVVERLPGA